MAFDSFVCQAVCAELQTILSSKIVKIHQTDNYSIVFKYYGLKKNGLLLISANPENARIHFLEQGGKNPLKPPLFCMVLRKHLEGGQISAIRQIDLERIIEIDFATRDDLGDPTVCRLIIEIMGKHSNIILVNKDNLIIDGIKRYSHKLSRHRQVLPGQAYIPPPPQNRWLLKGWEEEQLAGKIWQLPAETILTEAINKTAAGFSPLLAKEAVKRANLEEKTIVGTCGHYEISRLKQALDSIYNHETQPVIHYHKQKLLDYAAFPLLIWQNEEENFSSISQLLDYFYKHKEALQLFNNHQRELVKIIKAHHNRLKKKIKLQERDFAKSQAGDSYKECGDLLAANLYLLEKGLETIRLESFYEPGKIYDIELKPELTPSANVQRYYRLYNKAKKGHKMIEEQLTENRQEEIYLASVLVNIEQCQDLAELAEIRSELAAEGYLKTHKKLDKNKNKPLPPRSFLSQDGFTILVGRNNKQNDRLTLKMADKKDLWLHTQKIPGSHVIIKAGHQEIPLTTIEEAARLAAWYSKAQTSSQVPVDYTTADQVKKPRGAKPGMVIYFEQKTLYVTPQKPDDHSL
ncbi:MAG: Rqc2 family fibronectin-binding protein [Bacillota bacterium]|jgi:predicted ribosome quality control (RQC) complex YloA/Tae2 family protein